MSCYSFSYKSIAVLKTFTYSFFCIFLLLLLPAFLKAQGNNNLILLSGFIVENNTSNPVPGVHVYLPKAGRGTTTSPEGFFAIPVIPGDSVVISSVGYQKQYYRIPRDKSESYSVVIELQEDIRMLPAIEIFPYPTEELFKEAIVNLQLPDEEKIQALRRNLNQEIITRLALNLPMDANMNYRYQMTRDIQSVENQYFYPTFQVLNPFAWARFIQSIKRGDLKKDKWKK